MLIKSTPAAAVNVPVTHRGHKVLAWGLSEEALDRLCHSMLFEETASEEGQSLGHQDVRAFQNHDVEDDQECISSINFTDACKN